MQESTKNKIQIAKLIKQLVSYRDELLNQVKNQYPQRDGRQYYLGEVISLSNINFTAYEINCNVRYYNEEGGKQLSLVVPKISPLEYKQMKRKRD